MAAKAPETQAVFDVYGGTPPPPFWMGGRTAQPNTPLIVDLAAQKEPAGIGAPKLRRTASIPAK